MDSFKIRDKKADKSKATLKHRRIQKITTVFRFLELSIFFIILSRFSTQLSFSFNLLGEYFRGLSATLISPRTFVFLVGNAIVLFSISGQISAREGEKVMDFYDEYVEKCRNNLHDFKEENKIALAYNEPKKMSRCRSEKLERAAREKDLRRSMSEKCWKSGRKAGEEDEMSNEEFRQTVEAFIARQQRILKEEEET